MSLCEKCRQPIESEPQPEPVQEVPAAVKTRGRPLVFKTREERIARKSEYNRRYYNKMKDRLKTEIEKDKSD